MKYLLLHILTIISFSSMSQTEEQKFTVLNTIDDIEIREYAPVIYAIATSDNNNNLFKILAGYIFGGNESNQKIAMTAPVHMQEGSDSNEKLYTMKFVMPSEYTIDELSQPNDSRVKMEKVNKKKFAAIGYSGYNNDSKFNSHLNKLKKILDKNDISYSGKPIYLGYDAPYKFWGRRNEVLFELD